MSLTLDGVGKLVSLERGEVDRRIFSDPDIFEQELELIFGQGVAVHVPRDADPEGG